MDKEIKIGSRGSKLAIVQVNEVLSLLNPEAKNIAIKRFIFDTQGDKDKQTPLTADVPDDVFTDTLDKALLDKEIDIAVHSAKDLPDTLLQGLKLFALTKAVDTSDAFAGKVDFTKLAKGATVGTSSVLRQVQIKALNPALETVNIRGTIEERLQLIREGMCDGIVVATAALRRLGLEDRIKNIMPWETTPLQGQLAVVGRSADKEIEKIFEAIDVRKQYGTVTLVGAGPGDPELITKKGIKALNDAHSVFYDFLVDERLLEHAPHAEHINVGKRKGKHTLAQKDLSRMLRDKSFEGRRVVRLKGGDPFIFGRGADEVAYLRQYHIPLNVIPGVSSATAIPAGLGIPLTARGVSSSIAFISGHGEGEKDGKEAPVSIPDVDTVVFLMGLTKMNAIVKALKTSGRPEDMPVIVVSRGTREDERIVKGCLKDINDKVAEANLKPPALIIAGPTAGF